MHYAESNRREGQNRGSRRLCATQKTKRQVHSLQGARPVRIQSKYFLTQSEDDYKNNMKGKLKSHLSCIPEAVCFDISPQSDEFILLSTDGIFDALSLKSVVLITDDIAELHLRKVGQLGEGREPE